MAPTDIWCDDRRNPIRLQEKVSQSRSTFLSHCRDVSLSLNDIGQGVGRVLDSLTLLRFDLSGREDWRSGSLRLSFSQTDMIPESGSQGVGRQARLRRRIETFINLVQQVVYMSNSKQVTLMGERAVYECPVCGKEFTESKGGVPPRMRMKHHLGNQHPEEEKEPEYLSE